MYIQNYDDSTGDFILRIRETDRDTRRYSVLFADRTQNVISRLRTPIEWLLFQSRALKVAFRNQWRSYKYLQEYNSFLLGTYTEEEFGSIARQYAQRFTKIDENELRGMVSVLFELLDEKLTSGDLSELLNVDPSDIQNALSSYDYVQMDTSDTGNGEQNASEE